MVVKPKKGKVIRTRKTSESKRFCLAIQWALFEVKVHNCCQVAVTLSQNNKKNS